MWEKFCEGIEAKEATSGAFSKALMGYIAKINTEFTDNLFVGAENYGEQPKMYPLVDWFCTKYVKGAFGFEKCLGFLSGGAPMNDKVRDKFASLGLRIGDG